MVICRRHAPALPDGRGGLGQVSVCRLRPSRRASRALRLPVEGQLRGEQHPTHTSHLVRSADSIIMDISDPPAPIASTSSAPPPIDPIITAPPPPKSRLGSCALCPTPARYKCPACSTPTCSLAHSNQHKTLASPPCTGRAPPQWAQPIKANELSWGALMRDQAYLAGLSRNVEGVGKRMVEERLVPTGKERFGEGRSDKEVRLGREAGREGVRLVLLPKGMDKRVKNGSRWDNK